MCLSLLVVILADIGSGTAFAGEGSGLVAIAQACLRACRYISLREPSSSPRRWRIREHCPFDGHKGIRKMKQVALGLDHIGLDRLSGPYKASTDGRLKSTGRYMINVQVQQHTGMTNSPLQLDISDSLHRPPPRPRSRSAPPAPLARHMPVQQS